MSDFKLPFDGTILSDTNCVTNLGVFFDKTLSMEYGTTSQCRCKIVLASNTKYRTY